MKTAIIYALVFGVICVCIAFSILIFVIYQRIYKPNILPLRRMADAYTTPEKSAEVILVAKTTELSYRHYDTHTSLFLIFEFQNGERKDFLINTSVFNSFLEGDIGILTYHELGDTRIFVSFQRTK